MTRQKSKTCKNCLFWDWEVMKNPKTKIAPCIYTQGEINTGRKYTCDNWQDRLNFVDKETYQKKHYTKRLKDGEQLKLRIS